VPRDEHREDREHLLEDRGIEASGLRCLPGDLAAYVLRAEQAPQQLIAKAGVSGVGADDIIDEPRATQRLDLRRETCRFNRGRRLAVDTADERGRRACAPRSASSRVMPSCWVKASRLPSGSRSARFMSRLQFASGPGQRCTKGWASSVRASTGFKPRRYLRSDKADRSLSPAAPKASAATWIKGYRDDVAAPSALEAASQ
jgi:hypothetical protein